jgi:SsrA-binding protein
MTEGVKVIARNRKARHNYDILDTIEAGIVLLGSEIKSIRAGRANIAEGYVQHRNGEMWLLNVHIATYEQAGMFGHEPLRQRKLLLHKKEIARLVSQIQEKGLTIVPLQIHLWRGRAKVELGIARGKKRYDKREAMKQKDARREMDRALKERY